MQAGIYVDLIAKHLAECGFRREDMSSSDFDSVFIRRILGIKHAFLLKEIGEIDGGRDYILNLTKLGRNWCANNTRFFFTQTGLNFSF
jgi:hypothetical protein